MIQNKLLDDMKAHSESSRYGVYKTSIIGRLTTTFRIIHIQMIQIIQISSTFKKKTGIYCLNLNDISHQQIIHFLSPTLPVPLDCAVPSGSQILS